MLKSCGTLLFNKIGIEIGFSTEMWGWKNHPFMDGVEDIIIPLGITSSSFKRKTATYKFISLILLWFIVTIAIKYED